LIFYETLFAHKVIKEPNFYINLLPLEMSEDKRGAFLDLLEYVSEQISPKSLFALVSRFRMFSVQQNDRIKNSCNPRYQFLLELQSKDILNEDKVEILETAADYCRYSEQVRNKIKVYETTYLNAEFVI